MLSEERIAELWEMGYVAKLTQRAFAFARAIEAAVQAEKQEPVAWVGCGECDCEFPCYHGKTTCLRLPTEKQEPVAWMWKFKGDDGAAFCTKEPTLSIKDGVDYVPLYTHPQPDLTAEVERLKAERDSFCMDYRMKCDLETKQQAERIAAIEEAAREARDSLQYKLHVVEAIAKLDAVLGKPTPD